MTTMPDAAAANAPAPQTDDILLEVKDLRMHFPVGAGFLSRKPTGYVKAVDGVSFTVKRGETLGLVGESGCGKTTTGRCILQLYKPTSGQVLFEGQDLTTLSSKGMRAMRREMIVHGLVDSKQEYREKVADLLQNVGLNPYMADRFPHEFSGGQRQRIGVARALSVGPKFIVADEPVSALDVSIQAQIINLLEDLQEQYNLTYLFIAHDLSVVRHISDRVGVMYLGHMVEMSERNEIYRNPIHPYTKALLSAVPIPDPVLDAQRERVLLTGEVPSPLNPPSGCVFHPRCPEATDKCSQVLPELRQVEPDHDAACIVANGYGSI